MNNVTPSRSTHLTTRTKYNLSCFTLSRASDVSRTCSFFTLDYIELNHVAPYLISLTHIQVEAAVEYSTLRYKVPSSAPTGLVSIQLIHIVHGR